MRLKERLSRHLFPKKMGFIDGILSWLLEKILGFLLEKITYEIKDHVDQLAEDKKQGVINDANLKAYEEARDRQSRIDSALRLLNRDP